MNDQQRDANKKNNSIKKKIHDKKDKQRQQQPVLPKNYKIDKKNIIKDYKKYVSDSNSLSEEEDIESIVNNLTKEMNGMNLTNNMSAETLNKITKNIYNKYYIDNQKNKNKHDDNNDDSNGDDDNDNNDDNNDDDDNDNNNIVKNSKELLISSQILNDKKKNDGQYYTNEILDTLNLNNNKNLENFWKIYTTLLESIHLLWPECAVTELFLDMLKKMSNDEEKKKLIIQKWYSCMKPYFKDCLNHNISRLINSKIYFIEKINFIQKYHEIENDETSCNNVWEFIIALNRYSLEYHNFLKDDNNIMTKTIKKVTARITSIDDPNELLNNMESFGELIADVTSSVQLFQQNPKEIFSMFKKVMVLTKDVGDEENKNIDNIISQVPVDNSIKKLMIDYKDKFYNDDPDAVWLDVSDSDEDDKKNEKKTIEMQKNKKY